MCSYQRPSLPPKARPQLAGAPSVMLMDGLSRGTPSWGQRPAACGTHASSITRGLLASWAGQLHEWPARAFRGHQVGTKCLSLQRPLSSQGGWVHGQTTPASLSLQNPGQVPRGAACRGREDSGGLAAGGVNPRVYAAG